MGVATQPEAQGSEATVTPDPPDRLGAIRLQLPATVTVKRGADITSTVAIGSVPNFFGPRLEFGAKYGQEPYAAFHGRVLVRRSSRVVDSDEASQYLLWDPVDGTYELMWTAPDESRDAVSGTDRDWIATTRTGATAPHSDWKVIIRNLETGEVRVIAEVGAGAQRLGVGESPATSIIGGRVAWSELRVGDDGSRRTLVQSYDIAAESLTTVYEVDHMAGEEVRSVSLGGDRIAWIHERSDWRDSQLVIRELSTGAELRFVGNGKPHSGRLSRDGRFFAWDLESMAKFVLEIDTARVDRFANDEGDQIMVTEDGASWIPGMGPNPRGGYYDFNTRTVRLTAGNAGNLGGLLGEGLFYYREFTADERGQEIEELTTYYIIDISR
jgi:hypothetical protein